MKPFVLRRFISQIMYKRSDSFLNLLESEPTGYKKTEPVSWPKKWGKGASRGHIGLSLMWALLDMLVIISQLFSNNLLFHFIIRFIGRSHSYTLKYISIWQNIYIYIYTIEAIESSFFFPTKILLSEHVLCFLF